MAQHYINLENFFKATENFSTAYPFPHAVIDNFFDPDTASQLACDFPNWSSDMFNGHYDNAIELKKTCNIWDRFPSYTYRVFSYLNSELFTDFMTLCIRSQRLYADNGLHGGGWHIHPRGGKLNPHLDYSIHPKLGLQRKYNLLIYVNPNWQDTWGGHLGLFLNSADNLPGELTHSILPKFNRAILFDTTGHNWHGIHTDITCPDYEYRKSLATYYLIDPPIKVSQRGRALFAPTDEQKHDQAVLELIERRSAYQGEDPTKWTRA